MDRGICLANLQIMYLLLGISGLSFMHLPMINVWMQIMVMQLFIQYGIRFCCPTIIFCLQGEHPHAVTRFIKYIETADRLLAREQS